MHYYWVSVDRESQRQDFMRAQFEALGITEHTRVSAVTPDTVDAYSHTDDLELNGHYTCDPSRELFPKCQNCLLERCALISHMLALEKAYADGHEWFMVLEDDVVFAHEIDYAKVSALKPPDAEILQFSFTHPETIEILFNIFKENPQAWVRWQFMVPSALAYMVSRPACEKLFKLFKKDNLYRFHDNRSLRLADVMLYENSLTYVHPYPLFYQNLNLGSLIHPEHMRYHQRIVNMVKACIAEVDSHPFAIKRKILT